VSATLASWLAIVGVALTGVVTRCSFLILGERLRLPPLIEQALRHAPAAALGAIIAPALLLTGTHVELAPGNHRLLAALVAAAVIWWTRSILWTIVAGLAAFTALRLLT
jgi:branched-subunit amino acid transport protein